MELVIKNNFKFRFGLRSRLRDFFYKPNRDAIFVFGFQKSGTSALANLLANRVDLSVTIDTKYLWTPYKELILENKISIREIAEKHSYPFSADIFKEPNSTLMIPQLSEYFKLEKSIFIVRNPFNNIKSILDRLNIPGDLKEVEIKDINERWVGKLMNGNGENYIERLAYKWVEANNKYFELNDRVILIKYEDFNKEKINEIDKVVGFLQLKKKKSIDHLLSNSFQPRSKNEKDVESFFGSDNYKKIKIICSDTSNKFGYNT